MTTTKTTRTLEDAEAQSIALDERYRYLLKARSGSPDGEQRRHRELRHVTLDYWQNEVELRTLKIEQKIAQIARLDDLDTGAETEQLRATIQEAQTRLAELADERANRQWLSRELRELERSLGDAQREVVAKERRVASGATLPPGITDGNHDDE